MTMRSVGRALTVVGLVFALSAVATSDAQAGLLEKLLAKCKKNRCCPPPCCQPEPSCCEPEPVCCQPEPSCCEPAPCCEPEPAPCDCGEVVETTSDCGCSGDVMTGTVFTETVVESSPSDGPTLAPEAPDMAPEPPEMDDEAMDGPVAPETDDSPVAPEPESTGVSIDLSIE